jgi:hypothetical protein
VITLPSVRRYIRAQKRPSVFLIKSPTSVEVNSEILYTLRLHAEQKRARASPDIFSQSCEHGDAIRKLLTSNFFAFIFLLLPFFAEILDTSAQFQNVHSSANLR